MKSLVPLAVLALLASSCNIIPDARATLRHQPLELSGDFAASNGPGTTASSYEELGLSDEEDTLSPRADISWGGLDLMVSAYEYSNEGRGTANGTIDLGGTTIGSGESVTSSLDLTNAVALVTWDVIPTDLVDVGLGVGVSYLDLNLRVVGDMSGEAVTDESVPVPVLGARAEVELGPLMANLHVHGLALEYDGIDATYLDADLFLAYRFHELLGIDAQAQLGYRHIELDLEYDEGSSEVDTDLELSGVYFGLAVAL